MGNIQFVGELFRRKLLQESIIISVFDMLLGVEAQEDHLSLINDNTVEGAVVLMEKIGYMIDEKLNSLQANEEGGESAKGAKKSEQADAGVKDKIIKTFTRINELASDTGVPPVSTRVKMLIKNMLQNRA